MMNDNAAAKVQPIDVVAVVAVVAACIMTMRDWIGFDFSLIVDHGG